MAYRSRSATHMIGARAHGLIATGLSPMWPCHWHGSMYSLPMVCHLCAYGSGPQFDRRVGSWAHLPLAYCPCTSHVTGLWVHVLIASGLSFIGYDRLWWKGSLPESISYGSLHMSFLYATMNTNFRHFCNAFTRTQASGTRATWCGSRRPPQVHCVFVSLKSLL